MRAVESHASDDLQHHTTARAFRHVFEGPFFRRLMLRGIQSIPPSIQRATMPLWAVLFYLLLPQARRAGAVQPGCDRRTKPGCIGTCAASRCLSTMPR